MASLSVGAIIGIAVGGTALVLVAAVALVLLHIRDRDQLSRSIPIATRQQRLSRIPLAWTNLGDGKLETLRRKTTQKNKQKQRAVRGSSSSDSEESLTSLGVERTASVGHGLIGDSQNGIVPPPNALLGPESVLPKITLDLSTPPSLPYGNGFAQQQQQEAASQLAHPQAKRYSQLRAEVWNNHSSQPHRRQSASPSLSELIRDFGNEDALQGAMDRDVRRKSTGSRRRSTGPADALHLSMLSIVPSSEALPLAPLEKPEEVRFRSTKEQDPAPPLQPPFNSTTEYTAIAPPVGHAKQRAMSVASILAMDSGSAPSQPPPPLPRGINRHSISVHPKVYENPNIGSASSLGSVDSGVLDNGRRKSESYGPGVAFPFNSTSSPVSTVSRSSSIFEDATTWDTSPSIGLTSPFRGNSRQNSTSQATVSEGCSCPGSETSADKRKSSGRRFLRGHSICTLGGGNVDLALMSSPGYTDIFGEYASPERSDHRSVDPSPRNSIFREDIFQRKRHSLSHPGSVSRFPEDHVPLTQEQRDIVRAYRAEKADATNMSLQRNSVLARPNSGYGLPTKSILVHPGKTGQPQQSKQRRRASVTIGGEERYAPPNLSPIAGSEAPTPMLPEKSKRRSKSCSVGHHKSREASWRYAPPPPFALPAPQMNWNLGQRKKSSAQSTDLGGLPTGMPLRPSLSDGGDLEENQRKSSISADPVAVASAPFVIPKTAESSGPEKTLLGTSTDRTDHSTPTNSTSRERSRSRTRPEVMTVSETFASFPAPPKIPSPFMREAKALESKQEAKKGSKKEQSDAKSESKHDSGSEDESDSEERKAAAAEVALRKLEGKPELLPVAALLTEKSGSRVAAGVSAVERLEQRRKARREQMMQSTASGSARKQREKEKQESNKERRKREKGKGIAAAAAPEPVTPPHQTGRDAGYRGSQSMTDLEAQNIGLGLTAWD